MLNALVQRIQAGKGDRRTGDRLRRRFPFAWQRGTTLVPAQGLEISEKDVLFATKEAPPSGSIDVAMDLGGKRVRARVMVARQGAMQHEGAEWIIVAGVFEGIAADDWDHVVRFVRDTPEPENRSAGDLAALQSKSDDAYRLLPLNVQEKLVGVLVKAGKLAPESDARNPLLRLSYDGKTRGNLHRLMVHSRRNLNGEVLHFDSILHVDDAGNVTLVR